MFDVRRTIGAYHNDRYHHNRSYLMSVKVMAMVWDTPLPPHLKLVLLAYADHANDDGTSVYPGEERMAAKTSYSAGTVRRNTRALIDAGYLVQVKRGYRGQRAEFGINVHNLKGAHIDTLSNGAHLTTDSRASEADSRASDNGKARAGDTPNHHEPSEPSENHQLAERQRDPIWDTLCDLFGEPTKGRQSLYGRVTAYLHQQDATPEEMLQRSARIVQDWGPEKLTITSLENHWSRFDGLAGQLTNDDVAAAMRNSERERMRERLEAL